MSCILTIDDRPINRHYLVSLLGYGGHTVMEAADLDRMKNIASLACTPVIVLSARDPKTNEKRALDAGAEAFFQKPVDNEELMKAILHALVR